MSYYRKKPVTIKAVQWTGNMEPVVSLVGHELPTYGEGREGSLRIRTLEGDHECRMGDWIIKGVRGEFYPCKPDIFAATYEPVSGLQNFKFSDFMEGIS
jgi:hypothetical protein